MIQGKTAWVLVVAAVLLAGTGLAQSLQDNWNDFLHYTSIGRFDLAKGYAQAVLQSNPNPLELFALSQTNPAGYELALRVTDTAQDTELAELTGKLLKVIDQGRFLRRSDPNIIVEEVKRLTSTGSTPRGRLTAIARLRDAGEYAIPFMVDAMLDPARQAELPELIEALPQIGRPAIRPLGAALQTKNTDVRIEIVKALGKIGYPQALAYLKYTAEKDSSAEIRSLAVKSIQQIDPSVQNAPAAAQFYQLAESYYARSDALAPAEDVNFANMWFWDSQRERLTREAVSRNYFYELMTMRCCEWTLRADAQFGQAIGLWLAAFFKAEATGLPMPAYFGEGHADALVYATTAGPEYLHQALARGLKDSNADVALGAVEALAATAGEMSLFYTLGPNPATQPLMQALSFPDRAVRYSAAIAVANAGPAHGFIEAPRVARNLGEALSQNGKTVQEGDSRWTAALADEYAVRAAQAMLKLAVSRNAMIDLSLVQDVLVRATQDSRTEIQVLSAQVLAYLRSPGAQGAIAAMALNGQSDPNVRVSAFESLATSAKLNGNMLDDSVVGRIFALISAGETPADLRAAASAAYGALNLPSRKVKDLILGQAKS